MKLKLKYVDLPGHTLFQILSLDDEFMESYPYSKYISLNGIIIYFNGDFDFDANYIKMPRYLGTGKIHRFVSKYSRIQLRKFYEALEEFFEGDFQYIGDDIYIIK